MHNVCKKNCLTMDDSMVQKLSNLEQVIKSVPVSNVKAFLKQINNSDEIQIRDRESLIQPNINSIVKMITEEID